jgi:hypothetical protein
MKKILSLFLAMFLVVSLSGCNNAGTEEEFIEAQNNMLEMTNYTLEITMEYSGTNLVTTVWIDGNTRKILLYDSPIYFIQSDDGLSATLIRRFQLESEDSKFYEDTATIEDFNSIVEGTDYYTEFEYSDFTYEDGYYVATEYNNDIYSIRMKIEDGYMVTMDFQLYDDDDLINARLEFSDIESTSIDVPQYTSLEDFDDAISEMNLLYPDYNFYMDENGFTLVTFDTTFEYEVGEAAISFNVYNDNFYPDSQYVVTGGEEITLVAYLGLSSAMGDEALFAKLSEFYYYYNTEFTLN